MPSVETVSDDLLKKLGQLFLERRDVRAEQHDGGAYHPVREPFRLSDLRAHVEGKKTCGHYLLSPENKCRLFVFDIDLVKEEVTWESPDGTEESFVPREAFLQPGHWAQPTLILQLNTLALALGRRAHKMFGYPVAAAYSGSKGVHVYVFTGSEDAAEVRGAALDVIESFGDRITATRGENFFRCEGFVCEIEVFPKQTSLDGKDLGNLVRLPLGIHTKTGARGYFLRFDNDATKFVEMSPEDALMKQILPWE